MYPGKVKSSVFSRFIIYKNVLTHLYPKKGDFSNVLVQGGGEYWGVIFEFYQPKTQYLNFSFFEIDFVSAILGA